MKPVFLLPILLLHNLFSETSCTITIDVSEEQKIVFLLNSMEKFLLHQNVVFFFIDQCMGMALKINTFSSNGEFSLERSRGWVWDFHFRASQT